MLRRVSTLNVMLSNTYRTTSIIITVKKILKLVGTRVYRIPRPGGPTNTKKKDPSSSQFEKL